MTAHLKYIHIYMFVSIKCTKLMLISGLLSIVTSEFGGQIVYWINRWASFHGRGSVGQTPVALLC